MNAVILLNQQAAHSTKLEKPIDQASNHKTSIFQSMLSGENVSRIQDLNEEFSDGEEKGLEKLTIAHLLNLFDINELRTLDNEAMIADGTIEELLSLINSEQEVLSGETSEIGNFISVEGIKQLISQLLDEHNTLKHILINPSVTYQGDTIQNLDITDEQLHKLFNNLFQRAENLLTNLPTENMITKVSPQVLELLKEWVTLEQRNGKQSSTLFSKEEINTKEQKNWLQLVNTFKRRDQLATRHQYNRTAEVTSTDVAKWLSKLSGEVETVVSTGHQTSTNTMSRLEQYMIHINQTQQAPSVDQQIITRIETIMAKSNFTARSNGVNQLSIALKPDNLGEMMIRLVQINGEMTVKIMVTSLTTKKMLESNLHQLKNMFSPQQVIIEKQDVDILKAQEESKEQSLDDSNREKQQHENKEETTDDKEEFKLQFEQLLNEKV